MTLIRKHAYRNELYNPHPSCAGDLLQGLECKIVISSKLGEQSGKYFESCLGEVFIKRQSRLVLLFLHDDERNTVRH
jgi:hypothetical protein